MRILYLIPARAGSKGLPGKNTKLLGDKPLIAYSIEFALQNMKEGDELCISTNDQSVVDIADRMNVKVPFIRPEELASDFASSYEVMLHAVEYYEKISKNFDALFLLQPTSPLRANDDYKNIISAFDNDVDMVVSVKKSKENPYFTLFEEDTLGYLHKSKEGEFSRRQDCPEIYAFNGSMYLIRIEAMKKSALNQFKKVKKVIMPEERSVDIDTLTDWNLAEFYLKVNNEYNQNNTAIRY